MNIKLEIKRRLHNNDDTYNVIGAELKEKRVSLSKTLEAIASNDCSISYICKIERNQVKPSSYYLKEICQRLDITEDNLKKLFDSNKILFNTIKAFYSKDDDLLKKILDEISTFSNYRMLLSKYIIHIYFKEYNKCNLVYDKLNKISGSFSTNDLIIFTLFIGIYHYEQHNYKSSYDFLNLCLEFKYEIEYVRYFAYKYLFLISYKTNSNSFFLYYYKFLNLINDYGILQDIESIFIYSSKYLLLNRCFDEYKKEKLKITNKDIIKDLDFLEHILKNPIRDFTQIDTSTLSAENLLLVKILNKDSKIKEEVYNFKYSKKYKEFLYKYLYDKYCLYTFNNDNFYNLLNIAEEESNVYLLEYCKDEFSKNITHFKYKEFSYEYIRINNIINQVKNL